MPLPNQPQLEPEDFDGDGRIDEFEAAFSTESTITDTSPEIPPAPSFSIPKSPLFLYKRKESHPHQKQYQSCPRPQSSLNKKLLQNQMSTLKSPLLFGLGSNKKNGPLQK